MAEIGSSNPYSVKERDNGRRTPREFAKRRAGAIADGLRTSDAALRQMLHQTDEERQVLGFDPFLVEREDVLAGGGAHQVVGILNPFGDALERGHFANVVKRQKGAQRIVRDFGINGHVSSVEAAPSN